MSASVEDVIADAIRIEAEQDWIAAHDAESVSARILAALRAAGYVVERDWQDISTAPRDGTAFHAWVGDECRQVRWAKTSHVPIYGFCLVDQGAEDCDICTPTRWRPLPAPPATAAP